MEAPACPLSPMCTLPCIRAVLWKCRLMDCKARLRQVCRPRFDVTSRTSCARSSTTCKKLGVRGDVWIDGSFATQKPEPQDIDVALAIGWPALTAMTDANKQRLASLMNEEGRAYAQAKWNVDFYVFRATNFNERRYWFELFSKNPDSSNRKGIPFVRLT